MEQISESILDKQTAEPEKPKSRWKIRVAFVAIIFLVFGVVIGARAYKLWKEVDDAEKFEVKMLELKRMQELDTFGGATPYETLNLYISAIEKGDFALASKYFVIEKQEEELRSLQNSPKKNIENAMGMLKEANKSIGEYSEDKKEFSFYKPILVNFILYPSGNWKIEEI